MGQQSARASRHVRLRGQRLGGRGGGGWAMSSAGWRAGLPGDAIEEVGAGFVGIACGHGSGGGGGGVGEGGGGRGGGGGGGDGRGGEGEGGGGEGGDEVGDGRAQRCHLPRWGCPALGPAADPSCHRGCRRGHRHLRSRVRRSPRCRPMTHRLTCYQGRTSRPPAAKLPYCTRVKVGGAGLYRGNSGRHGDNGAAALAACRRRS